MMPLSVSSPVLVAVSGAAPPVASLMMTHSTLAPMCWDATWSAMVALCVFTMTQASLLLVAVIRGQV
jgi:hypothetical protein